MEAFTPRLLEKFKDKIEKLERFGMGGMRMQFTDEHLAFFVKMKGALKLNCMSVRNFTYKPIFKEFCQKTNLEFLEISEVTDRHLALLKNCTGLKSLSIHSGSIVAKGFGDIKNLPIEYLFLNCPVEDKVFSDIKFLPGLETLVLRGSKVTDKGLSAITSLKNLKKLTLMSNGDLTTKALMAVSSVKSLTHLKMDRWRDYIPPPSKSKKSKKSKKAKKKRDNGSKEFTIKLKELSNLKSLEVESLTLDNSGLLQLAGMKDLEELKMPLLVDDIGVKYLAKLTKLTALNIRGQYSRVKEKKLQVSDKGMTYLKNLTALRILALGDTRVSSKGIKHLAAMTELEALDLTQTAIDDKAIETLSKLKALRRLAIGSTKITKEGRALLKKELRSCVIR